MSATRQQEIGGTGRELEGVVRGGRRASEALVCGSGPNSGASGLEKGTRKLVSSPSSSSGAFVEFFPVASRFSSSLAKGVGLRGSARLGPMGGSKRRRFRPPGLGRRDASSRRRRPNARGCRCGTDGWSVKIHARGRLVRGGGAAGGVGRGASRASALAQAPGSLVLGFRGRDPVSSEEALVEDVACATGTVASSAMVRSSRVVSGSGTRLGVFQVPDVNKIQDGQWVQVGWVVARAQVLSDADW